MSDETCTKCHRPFATTAHEQAYPTWCNGGDSYGCLRAQLAESERKLARMTERFNEEDDRAESWKDTADERLRQLMESQRTVARLEGLFQQTHGCHWSWVHKVTELQAELEKLRGAP